MHRSTRTRFFFVMAFCLLPFGWTKLYSQSVQGACLYALDPSAKGAFSISGSASITTNCSIAVASDSSAAFVMGGSETLYLGNHAAVGVVGGWQLNGQSAIDTISNQAVQPIQITTPADPLAALQAPTQGAMVSSTHTYYDMNSAPANDTLTPGVYCGGLEIGNTNGATFTLSPGTYIMAGGGMTLDSLAQVSGSGVTIYNTSSAGWGCPSTYNYDPITVSSQTVVSLSAPTSGPLTGIVLFADRAGCAVAGSCQDQINGGATTAFNGVLYLKNDALLFTGNSTVGGCLAVVADTIAINGKAALGGTSCYLNPISVAIAPPTTALYGGQSQQFSATVSNTYFTDVAWSISPAGTGTIDSTGNYTAPPIIGTEQTVTVTARSDADTTKSASAVVTLFPPMTISMTPTTTLLYQGQQQTFTAVVSNALNTAVNWTIAPAGSGTINASGVYTAPANITSLQTVTVIATSQANPAVSVSAVVTLSPPITVSVNPVAGTLSAGQTQQFTATVLNTNNTAVTWSISPAGVGTITASGLYTAPASIASSQSVTITATSEADPTKSASAVVQITISQCLTNGYSYVRTIVIDHTKVSNTDQVNFPFLFNTTDPALATTANGGHVSNANGYDIIFSTDPSGTTKLDHEVEEYNPVTGQVVAWIRLPSLSHTADTILYVFYGNRSITTSQQNPAGVWDTNFTGVWHFPSGTTLTANDSTLNGDTGTIGNGVAAAAGFIDGGASFNGSGTAYISLPSSSTVWNFAGDMTLSAWMRTTGNGMDVIQLQNGNPLAYLSVGPTTVGGSSNTAVAYFRTNTGGVQIANGNSRINDGNWHNIQAVRSVNSGSVTLFVDGKLDSMTSYSDSGPISISGGAENIGGLGGGYQFRGNMDEVRISNSARSADWIASEFNNQSSPATFYSLSAENAQSAEPSAVSLFGGESQQFTATAFGACGAAVLWTMPSGSPGSLTTAGLYTAPATISTQQQVTLTATNQLNPNVTATAQVTLLPPPLSPTLTLSAVAMPPYVVGTVEQFVAMLRNQDGTPLAQQTVSFTVSGVNATAGSAITNSSGTAYFTYTGSKTGADTVTSSLTIAGSPVTSNAVAVSWLAPVQAISTTTVTGQFFLSDGSGAFDTSPTATPAFTQTFPTINFNPPSGTVPGNTSSVNVDSRPFTDVTTDLNGNFTGTIVAQGNGNQAGVGSMTAFQAVFRGMFTVASAGNVVFNFYDDDGFIFGVGNGATRVSGASYNMPNSTPFGQYPVMGAYNGPTAPIGNQIVVNFPAPGSYPYEVDYSECCGGQLVLTMTQGATSATGVAPTGSLTLSPSSVQPLPAGGQQAFTVLATDASGAPVSNLHVSLVVTGTDDLQLTGTTDSTGHVTVVYQDVNPGTATVQAVGFISGMVAYSNMVSVPWTLPASSTTVSSGSGSTLSVSISGQNTVILPNTLSLSGSVSDSALPSGGTITTTWSELSGPGTVSFANPQQLATTASFSKPGSYVLLLSATDPDASGSLQFPVTVNPAPGVTQGWIGSPLDGAAVSGIVPITVASGVTLVSGTLTYYPASNPSSVTVLNANTTGSGQIGSLDTTTLANGSYWITLQATNSSGTSEYNLALVTVTGNLKPGRVTSTVTDLVVPSNGLAIQIQRRYDSLYASTSMDFGYGWSLGTNVDLTVGPRGDVTFTIGGQRKTFYLTPQYGGWLFPYYFAAFTPEPGLHGTLTDSAPGCATLFDILVPDGNLWACVGGGFYTPPGYVYTDPSGTSYTISANGNLQSIVDKNGNTLAIGTGGITSSTGLQVTFARDSNGRITQITDPKGNAYLYAYDASGNLASVTYPNTAQPSTYTYDAAHHYLSGTDFRGNPLPTTDYYTSADTDPNGNSLAGRLKSVTDALSETTSYAYNLSTNTTTVTYPSDAGGNVGTATMVYDGYGDVLSSTDPLGHTTTNVYDANRNLTSVTDPLGHVTTYTYDANGNKTSTTYPATATSTNTTSTTAYNQYSEPTQTTDELGNIRTFAYDANFNPVSVTDSTGTLASFQFNTNGTMQAGAVGYDISSDSSKASHFTYDANGNLASRTDALGRTTSYTYDALGHKLTQTEPLPNSGTSATAATTSYTYDAFGNLTQTAAPLGRTTSSKYDGNGNKVSDTDARGNTTTYQYDALNRLILTTYPDGSTDSKTYDFRGNVVSETDQAGHVTRNVYDLAGRLTSKTMGYGTASATTTTYAYDNAGRKISQTDGLGHTTDYTYDAAGDLTALSGVQGNFTYDYDNARNRISMTDGNGHTTSYQYDARKRLVETDYPDGTKKTDAYDGPGNLISVTDQAGNEVQYTYDAANQLTGVVEVNSPNTSANTTTYGYDALGDLTGLTDANGHTTQNSFDLLLEPVSKTLPDGSLTETRQYDTAGNLISLTHFNGAVTTYTYDSLNRLLSRSTPGEATVSFTYTPTGKRQTMTDASGTTNYTYDGMDRLTQKATPEGTLSYTYDAAGNVASMQSSNANGANVSYTYDTLNRLATVVDSRLGTTTYAYDPASNVTTVTYPNGVQSALQYDPLNRVTGLATQTTGYIYQRGPAGNLTSATELSGRTVNWSYDGIYRLTNETISLAPSKNNGSVSYGLDPVGNRQSENSSLSGVPSGSWSYNADDELSSETYDADGNVTAEGGKTFSYDSQNHLVAMNGTVALLYDGDGNRVAKSVNGVVTRYLVDELNPTGYAQVVDELTSGAVTRTYTYGLQRISQDQVISNTWTPSFYSYDGGGNVRALTNTAGATTDSYEYDAFGNSFTVTGTTPNNYLYRGEQYDPDMGLYYLRARYYNPLTGRFMSRDPEDGVPTDPKTLHKYVYAGGDPVDAKDTTGKDFVEVASVDMNLGVRDAAAVEAVGAAVACSLNQDAELLKGLYTNLGSPIESITFGPCTAKVKKECTLGGDIGAVVIGEDMAGRIRPYAESIRAGYYDPPPGPPYLWLNNNLEWINEVMDEGCRILDGGPAPGRENFPYPTSPYYFEERVQIGLRGYPTQPVSIPSSFAP